jgi:hypothetical protein
MAINYGGQSWTRVGPADGGDKQWFTIDNTNSSGRGFQYQSGARMETTTAADNSLDQPTAD